MSVADLAPRQLARHGWLRLARRARILSWLSLGHMTVEGAVAITAPPGDPDSLRIQDAADGCEPAARA